MQGRGQDFPTVPEKYYRRHVPVSNVWRGILVKGVNEYLCAISRMEHLGYVPFENFVGWFGAKNYGLLVTVRGKGSHLIPVSLVAANALLVMSKYGVIIVGIVSPSAYFVLGSLIPVVLPHLSLVAFNF